MAEDMSGLFKKTERPEIALDEKSRKENPVKAHGVGLRKRQWDYLEKHAKEIGGGMTGHAIAVYLLTKSINQLQAGEIEIPVETVDRKVIKG